MRPSKADFGGVTWNTIQLIFSMLRWIVLVPHHGGDGENTGLASSIEEKEFNTIIPHDQLRGGTWSSRPFRTNDTGQSLASSLHLTCVLAPMLQLRHGGQPVR